MRSIVLARGPNYCQKRFFSSHSHSISRVSLCGGFSGPWQAKLGSPILAIILTMLVAYCMVIPNLYACTVSTYQVPGTHLEPNLCRRYRYASWSIVRTSCAACLPCQYGCKIIFFVFPTMTKIGQDPHNTTVYGKNVTALSSKIWPSLDSAKHDSVHHNGIDLITVFIYSALFFIRIHLQSTMVDRCLIARATECTQALSISRYRQEGRLVSSPMHMWHAKISPPIWHLLVCGRISSALVKNSCSGVKCR